MIEAAFLQCSGPYRCVVSVAVQPLFLFQWSGFYRCVVPVAVQPLFSFKVAVHPLFSVNAVKCFSFDPKKCSSTIEAAVVQECSTATCLGGMAHGETQG